MSTITRAVRAILARTCARTAHRDVFVHAAPEEVVRSLPSTKSTYIRSQDVERGRYRVDVEDSDGHLFSIVRSPPDAVFEAADHPRSHYIIKTPAKKR